MNKKKFKILYIATRGGHLTELLHLKPNFKKEEVEELFVLNRHDSSINNLTVQDHFYLNKPWTIIQTFILAFRYLLENRPYIIISTGAEIAIPFIVLGKIFFNVKIIYIESCAQMTYKSKTGMICYLFSDKFYVQWPSMLKVYGKKAKFLGGVLCSLHQ